VTAEAIGQFRRRRRWRHVLAMVAGGAALVLGTAVVAAQLTHRNTAGLPSAGAGAGLYIAGALLAAWGAAGGFTRRLAGWLPACLAFGVLAVLVFMAATVFASDADAMTYKAGPGGASGRAPGPPGRVLAAELLGQDEIGRLLGPAPADLTTPGATAARAHSVAIWRNDQGMVSLNVKYSPRRAARLERNGHTVSHYGRVLRVRAGRDGWLMALQLRSGIARDPEPLLAELAGQALGRLAAASAPARLGSGPAARGLRTASSRAPPRPMRRVRPAAGRSPPNIGAPPSPPCSWHDTFRGNLFELYWRAHRINRWKGSTYLVAPAGPVSGPRALGRVRDRMSVKHSSRLPSACLPSMRRASCQ
jgi:hypothetical protein